MKDSLELLTRHVLVRKKSKVQRVPKVVALRCTVHAPALLRRTFRGDDWEPGLPNPGVIKICSSLYHYGLLDLKGTLIYP